MDHSQEDEMSISSSSGYAPSSDQILEDDTMIVPPPRTVRTPSHGSASVSYHLKLYDQ